MQEQAQQTLLPGLKLSYDHPHFAEERFFVVTGENVLLRESVEIK